MLHRRGRNPITARFNAKAARCTETGHEMSCTTARFVRTGNAAYSIAEYSSTSGWRNRHRVAYRRPLKKCPKNETPLQPLRARTRWTAVGKSCNAAENDGMSGGRQAARY